jgi:hypothetical protein
VVRVSGHGFRVRRDWHFTDGIKTCCPFSSLTASEQPGDNNLVTERSLRVKEQRSEFDNGGFVDRPKLALWETSVHGTPVNVAAPECVGKNNL